MLQVLNTADDAFWKKVRLLYMLRDLGIDAALPAAQTTWNAYVNELTRE